MCVCVNLSIFGLFFCLKYIFNEASFEGLDTFQGCYYSLANMNFNFWLLNLVDWQTLCFDFQPFFFYQFYNSKFLGDTGMYNSMHTSLSSHFLWNVGLSSLGCLGNSLGSSSTFISLLFYLFIYLTSGFHIW